MNTENILALAAKIETLPQSTSYHDKHGFYMQVYVHECGSPSCIAGWAAHMSGRSDENIREIAKEWLGLDWPEADELFLRFPPLELITPAWAASVLRNLVKTGEVRW